MTISEYLRVLRQQWAVIVALSLVTLFGAGLYTWLSPRVYQAHAQLFVSTRTSSDMNQMSQAGVFTQQRVKSYVDVVYSPPVLQDVITKLALPYTAENLAEHVTAKSPLDTVLLDISVDDRNAERSRDIANAIAKRFPDVVDSLETPKGDAVSPIKVSILKAAVTPTSPMRPRPTLNLALGLLFGLALGLGFALLKDTLDRTLTSKEEVQEKAGAPVLTAIGEDPSAAEHRLITHDAFSPRAESFRQLRTNIRFLSIDHSVRSVVVTSSVPSEGKSTTACNLAIALAQAGDPVVLIDADLRRPTVSDVFALSSGVGLTSVLLGDLLIDDAAQQWRSDLPLRVLTAGPLPPNPSELIGSVRMAALIKDLTDRGITVVIDSPPLLPVTDAALLARATDGALMVARAASTHGEQLTAACDSLRIAGATVLGVVLNRVPRRRASSYYGGYEGYHGYRSTTPAASAAPAPAAAPPARKSGSRRPRGKGPKQVIVLDQVAEPRIERPPAAPPAPAAQAAPPPVVTASIHATDYGYETTEPSPWHTEWASLPALVVAPRAEASEADRNGYNARHRN